MSERKADAEIVRKQCAHKDSLIDEDDIIDVSAFDFDDTDGWLYVPKQYQTESTVHDLYTWLRSEPELVLSANRKCIDTRTFTRPKKRSSRTSFESIFEALPPSSPNVWKNQCSNFTNIQEDINRCAGVSIGNKEEGVPSILKMVPTTAANLLSDENVGTSGQESMEVFLNMSHSKGIDSFINLTEPGFGDPLMNISQPSIFYSSITSMLRDDSLHTTDYDEEEKSLNLTQLMSHRVNRSEVANSNNMNETFSRADTTLNDKSCCMSPTNRTFTNKSETFENMKLNETYDREEACKTLILSTSDKDKTITTNLSSTFVKNDDDDDDTKSVQSQSKEKKDFLALDATYPSQEAEKNSSLLDAAYLSLRTEQKDGIDTHKDKIKAHDFRKNINCSAPMNQIEASTPVEKSRFPSTCENPLDSTFKLPIPLCNQSTPKNLDGLNSTFKTFTKHSNQPRTYNAALCSSFKTPTSLRKELLAEIQRSGERRLDSTYNHIGSEHFREQDRKEIADGVSDQNHRNDIPIENKYNTYKKESSTNQMKSQADSISNTGACAQEDLQDRKYYTFTKKGGAHGGKTDMENAESLENVDGTFVKPFPKLQNRKQHIPRMLSKLPQFLQKSNPNLVSNSLKTVNMTGCGTASSVGYLKGSQPNIGRDVEKGLTNKLYSMGKMKSGSEQRLLELNTNATEFQMLGAGGSTESIESTQSAHSAPDLDDRLSTCSDCSHNSYTTQTMNIEQLHQIVRMQEESLKQDSTPKLNRRVLENTWIEAKKDLPSPILKNGIDGCESDSSSPLSIDFTVKTSSPILSPTGSSQSLNSDNHPTENILKQQNEGGVKKVEVINKPATKVENKTRLRQPTNWSTGTRPSNVISAIPRPQSRIPAPRFARPIAKNTQGDVKRGYM